jgi:hypothetical protein
MLKNAAKYTALAVSIPAAGLAWAWGFMAMSFTFQTPGSCYYLLVTAFLVGALAKRWW